MGTLDLAWVVHELANREEKRVSDLAGMAAPRKTETNPPPHRTGRRGTRGTETGKAYLL